MLKNRLFYEGGLALCSSPGSVFEVKGQGFKPGGGMDPNQTNRARLGEQWFPSGDLGEGVVRQAVRTILPHTKSEGPSHSFAYTYGHYITY